MSGSAAGRPTAPGSACWPCPDPLRRGRGGRLGGGRGRHHRPGPSARRRRPKRGPSSYLGSAVEADQALGRSRGGLTTKLHLAGDGQGRPLGMLVTAGQRHESTQLEPLLDTIRVPRPGRVGPASALTTWLPTGATAIPPAAGCCGVVGSPTPFPSALTSRRLGPGAVLGVVGRRPWIGCATGTATWSSGVLPGSSSTGPSRPGMTSWPSATRAGWSWPPCCSGSQHEPSDTP